eukprot:1156806-Pelagomonas_calceolata.AAC.1
MGYIAVPEAVVHENCEQQPHPDAGRAATSGIRKCRGNFLYINLGKGDTLAQKSHESPPPQRYRIRSANGDLEGYWKHPAPEPPVQSCRLGILGLCGQQLVQSNKTGIGAGVYIYISNSQNLVDLNFAGITNTIGKAKLAAVAAALTNTHTLPRTPSAHFTGNECADKIAKYQASLKDDNLTDTSIPSAGPGSKFFYRRIPLMLLIGWIRKRQGQPESLADRLLPIVHQPGKSMKLTGISTSARGLRAGQGVHLMCRHECSEGCPTGFCLWSAVASS